MKKQHHLDDLFDELFVSSEIRAKKPESDFFDILMRQPSRIQKKDVLFWDDRPAYVEAGKMYGFPSFLYADFDTYSAELRRQGLV